MNEPELIDTFRKNPNQQTLASLSDYFKFNLQIVDGDKTDGNLQFRAGVVEALLQNFSLKDILLIRELFRDELACDKEIRNHDNLYQLCYYLYSLGQPEDSFILYDAKFKATNMDTALMLDRQLITVGHAAEEVIAYVEKSFRSDVSLSERYPGLLIELNKIKQESAHHGLKEYKAFLDSYFNVKDDVTAAKENIIKKRRMREEQARVAPEKAITDLNIFYKAFCFFIIFPRYNGVSLLDLDTNLILKRQQSNYYLVTGVSFFIIAIMLAINYNIPFLLIWCSGFGLSYLFDTLYNKRRQIDDIKNDWPRNPYKTY